MLWVFGEDQEITEVGAMNIFILLRYTISICQRRTPVKNDCYQERCDGPGRAGDPAPGQRHCAAGGHQAECARPGGGDRGY